MVFFPIEYHMVRMRMIVQNSKKELILARSGRKTTNSPIQAECEAALVRQRSASALLVTKLIIERDSQIVIQGLQNS